MAGPIKKIKVAMMHDAISIPGTKVLGSLTIKSGNGVLLARDNDYLYIHSNNIVAEVPREAVKYFIPEVEEKHLKPVA